MAAEAPRRPFFNGDEDFMLPRQLSDQIGVQRLGEAGIGDRGR